MPEDEKQESNTPAQEQGAQAPANQPAAQAPQQAPSAANELLKSQVTRKTYALNTIKRYNYVKSYNVLKRVGEEEQNKYVKMVNDFVSRFTKKKEE